MGQLLNSVGGTLMLLNKLTYYVFLTKHTRVSLTKIMFILWKEDCQTSKISYSFITLTIFFSFLGILIFMWLSNFYFNVIGRWFRGKNIHVQSSNEFKVPRNLANVLLFVAAIVWMVLVSNNIYIYIYIRVWSEIYIKVGCLLFHLP
jgi:hypothetical protein